MELSSTTFAVMFVVAFLGCYGLMYLIDHRYGLQLVKWTNGEVDSPFTDTSNENLSVNENSEVEQLRERVEYLEKIVTDSSYELNEKLRKL